MNNLHLALLSTHWCINAQDHSTIPKRCGMAEFWLHTNHHHLTNRWLHHCHHAPFRMTMEEFDVPHIWLSNRRSPQLSLSSSFISWQTMGSWLTRMDIDKIWRLCHGHRCCCPVHRPLTVCTILWLVVLYLGKLVMSTCWCGVTCLKLKISHYWDSEWFLELSCIHVCSILISLVCFWSCTEPLVAELFVCGYLVPCDDDPPYYTT